MSREQSKTFLTKHSAALAITLAGLCLAGAAQAVTLPKPAATATAGGLKLTAGVLTAATPTVNGASPQLFPAYQGLTSGVAASSAQTSAQGLTVNPLQAGYTALGGQGTTPVSFNTFANTKVGSTTVTGTNPFGNNIAGVAVASPTPASGSIVTIGVLSAGKLVSASPAALH